MQEAAHRVPAAVTVRQVDTLQWLISLGLLQTTALLAMQGDMVLVVAQLAYALVTVPQVDTLQLLTSLAPLQTIASRVMLANTVREAAHRVPAVATVR